jgi:hypothetical protein
VQLRKSVPYRMKSDNDLRRSNAPESVRGCSDRLIAMEQASQFDDRESLAIPANQVLAIVRNSAEAREIVQTLNRNGFRSEEIGVLSGTEDAEKLDPAAGKQGFLSKLTTVGVDLGERDTDSIKKYRRALLNGRTVVSVAATNEEARNTARKILKERGARFITYFGQFVTEVLEA